MSTSRRGRLAALTALILLLAVAPAALAHAELVRARPADGETVPPGPIDIVATFDEPLRPNSHVELHAGDRGGEVVSHGAIDGRTLRIGLEGLLPGEYTVTWTSEGQDREIARGFWSFTVAEAAAPSPSQAPSESASPTETPSVSPSQPESPTSEPSPSVAPSPSAGSGTATSGGDVVLPIVAVIAIVIAGLAALVLRGRRGA